MIDDAALIEASEGHVERMSGVAGASVNPIDAALAGIGVAPMAARTCLQAFVDERKPAAHSHTAEAAYMAGLLDGLVVGVRAARIEAARQSDPRARVN